MTDHEMDVVYDAIDLLCREGKFEALDWFLHQMYLVSGEEEMLTVLTATLPAKSKLPRRYDLYCVAESLYGKYGPKEDDKLFAGLK